VTWVEGSGLGLVGLEPPEPAGVPALPGRGVPALGDRWEPTGVLVVPGREARGIDAASVCDVRGGLEKVDALGWRKVKRRERRGPEVGLLGVEPSEPAGVPAVPGRGGSRRRQG